MRSKKLLTFFDGSVNSFWRGVLRCARLEHSMEIFPQGRDRNINSAGIESRQLSQHVNITADERILRDDFHRVTKLRENFHTATRQLQASLNRLIRIGDATHGK